MTACFVGATPYSLAVIVALLVLPGLAAAIRPGGAAQVHAGIFNVRHTAGKGLLGLFQQSFTVHRCISGQIFAGCSSCGQDLGGALAAAF